jgi:CheY-like chemotaxis protein
MPKSILIVDDSDLVRGALRRMIDESKQFVVCGEAANGKEAIDQAAKLQARLGRFGHVDARDERIGSSTSAEKDSANCPTDPLHVPRGLCRQRACEGYRVSCRGSERHRGRSAPRSR